MALAPGQTAQVVAGLLLVEGLVLATRLITSCSQFVGCARLPASHVVITPLLTSVEHSLAPSLSDIAHKKTTPAVLQEPYCCLPLGSPRPMPIQTAVQYQIHCLQPAECREDPVEGACPARSLERRRRLAEALLN